MRGVVIREVNSRARRSSVSRDARVDIGEKR